MAEFPAFPDGRGPTSAPATWANAQKMPSRESTVHGASDAAKDTELAQLECDQRIKEIHHKLRMQELAEAKAQAELDAIRRQGSTIPGNQKDVDTETDPFANEPPHEFIRLTNAVTRSYTYCKLLWAGLKPDTRNSYRPAVRSYEQFCALTNITPWPATRNSLGHWVTERSFGSNLPLQGQIQPTTLQSYVSALHSVHVDLGYEVAVFDSSHIQRLIQGAKNLFPPPKKRDRLPITRAILLAILSLEAVVGEHPIDQVTLNAAFSLAFAGFMRLGEITYKDADQKDARRLQAEKVTRQGVTFSVAQDYLTVHLPRSKTDYSNNGIDILVASADDNVMLALMQQDPQEAGQPLFRLHNRAFTRNRVLKLLANRLIRCGINAAAYKGHSFRKGAADEAYKQHLSHEQIQALRRWTSEAVNWYYQRDPTGCLHCKSNSLQVNHYLSALSLSHYKERNQLLHRLANT